MRSILAGLRQLVVPWGARTAPRIVIGGEDPLALASQREASIVFYVADSPAEQAFILAVNVDGSDFPQFNLFTADAAGPTASVLDVTYQLSLQRVDSIDLGTTDVGSLRLGAGAQNVLLGGPSDTDLVLSTSDRWFVEDAAGDQPEMQVGGRQIGFEVDGDEGVNGGLAFSTTSATFVNVTGAVTENFVKKFDDTRVVLHHHMTMQADGAFNGWEIALNFNDGAGFDTDYRTGRNFCAAAAVAGQPLLTGGHRVIDGIPAGTYTVTQRVRRYVGAGNIIWAATNSYGSFTASEEIAAP